MSAQCEITSKKAGGARLGLFERYIPGAVQVQRIKDLGGNCANPLMRFLPVRT